MAEPRILVGEKPSGGSPRETSPDFEGAWRILGVTSWVLIVVGGVDLGLTLYPLRLGSPEWEFGTASRLLDNLPLLTVGVMLQLASAAATGARVRLQVLSWLMPFAVVLVLVAAVLFGLALPLALREVTEPGERLLLQKAAAKTGVQALCYGALYAGVFVMTRRNRR